MAKKPKKDEYKDAYSSKVYKNVDTFLKMKLSHLNTNFTKLYKGLYKIVKSGKKETIIDVRTLGMETMDIRLPRYVLGFINGGKDWKAAMDKKNGLKLTLTKK